MEDVKVNTSKTITLTLPSDADSNNVSAVLVHEFGDVVKEASAATRESQGVYSITYGQNESGLYDINSSGKHRVDFTYQISGDSYTQSVYINAYTPYISWDEYALSHPEMVSLSSGFETLEKRARNIINTFCGQSFEFYPNKSIIIDGNNHTSLHLPIPISTLRKVTMDYGDVGSEILYDSTNDSINNIEKVRQNFNFESSYFIRFKSNISQSTSGRIRNKNFNANSDYKIEGDFGWRYVPQNVKQAADLLILDMMNDDSEYRRHAVTSVDMDTMRFTMASNFYESTGNIEADILLMDYTLFIMDYIT